MSKSTSQRARPRVIRKLGYFERFQVSLQVLDLCCGTMVTSLYNIPQDLRNPSSHDKLVNVVELAVADTLTQHPLLQVGLVGERTRKSTWVQLDQIDLAQQIEWQVVKHGVEYDSMLNDLSMRQLDTKFGDFATRPGWRLVVLELVERNLLEIMFVWNHTNLDGTGGRIFHESLLRSLNSVTGDANHPSLVNHIYKPTVTVDNMLPSQEVIAKYRITPGFAAANIWSELKPPALSSKSTYVSWADITLTPRKTQLRSISVINDTVQKVLSACRSRKTTLTAALHGIAFMSLAHQLPEDKVASMVGETPLDLRRFIKHPGLEPNKLIGNYVTKMGHEFDKALVQKVRQLSRSVGEEERFAALEEEMWSAAGYVRGEIQDKLDLGLKNDIAGLMAWVWDWETFQKDEMKKPRTASWLVTNVGVIDGRPEESSAWSIERSKFSLAAEVIGSVFGLSMITAKGKDMCVDVMWQDGVADAGVAERLLADVGRWLDYIAHKG